MDLRTLLVKLKDEKVRVLINGMGAGTTRGLITEVNGDYITYELLDIKEEKTKQKSKRISETKYIPIAHISDLSLGQTETEGSQSLGKLQEAQKEQGK